MVWEYQDKVPPGAEYELVNPYINFSNIPCEEEFRDHNASYENESQVLSPVVGGHVVFKEDRNPSEGHTCEELAEFHDGISYKSEVSWIIDSNLIESSFGISIWVCEKVVTHDMAIEKDDTGSCVLEIEPWISPVMNSILSSMTVVVTYACNWRSGQQEKDNESPLGEDTIVESREGEQQVNNNNGDSTPIEVLIESLDVGHMFLLQ